MSTPPNILFIFTDQQSATMMSGTGNPHLKTPAMDSLAATGMRFDRAYCTSPVCMPSRFSLMTGRMPSEIGMRANGVPHLERVPQDIIDTGTGWVMKNAGYDVAYGGKHHLPKMSPEDIGFDYFCRDERDGLADACIAFLQQDRDKPFFLAASFINPHDICYMAIRDFARTDQSRGLLERGTTETRALDEALRLPEGMDRNTFFDSVCPPLPDNHAPQEDEPAAVRQLIAKRPFRQAARDSYTEEQWRLHRWAFCRLTERVDAQIGRVLDALRASGQEENTVVIFTSDHGDMDAAHKMEHKTAFYEEAARIPMIISQPGTTAVGTTPALVSNGLDLLPTLCDYAGIETPDHLAGVSMRPLAEGRGDVSPRPFLPIENEIGRAIVTPGYKYMLHDDGENREQLIDLTRDPGETRNWAKDPELADVLDAHRQLFAGHFGK